MFKIILLSIVLVISTACTSNINQAMQKQIPQRVDNKQIPLFVAISDGCESSGRVSLSCRTYLQSVKEGAQTHGFKVVDNIRAAEYTLFLESIDVNDGDVKWGRSLLSIFGTLTLLPFKSDYTMTGVFSLVKAQDIERVKYGKYPIPKKGAQVHSYTSKFEWNQTYNAYDQSGADERAREYHSPKAMVGATRVALNQMIDEYIFDE